MPASTLSKLGDRLFAVDRDGSDFVRIRIPILLMHGTRDDIVPVAQSRAMKKALEKSGRKVELVEPEGEGHSCWSDENEMLALSSIDAFLWSNLGAGYGSTTPPAARGSGK